MKKYIQTCTCVNSCWVGFPLLGPFGTRCGGMKFLPPKGKCPLRPSDLTVPRPTWNRCCAEPRKVYFKKNAKWNKNKSHVKSSSNQTAICMIFFVKPWNCYQNGTILTWDGDATRFPNFLWFFEPMLLTLLTSWPAPHGENQSGTGVALSQSVWAAPLKSIGSSLQGSTKKNIACKL